MELLNLTTRSQALGLPIGPKRVDRGKVVKVGLGVAAAVGAGIAVRKLSRSKSGIVETGRDVLSSATDAVEEAWHRAFGASNGLGSVLGAFEARKDLWPFRHFIELRDEDDEDQEGPARDEEGRFVAQDDEETEEGERRERVGSRGGQDG